ncbi:MAG: NYN domain-containing protein [Clostridia bacterium]|nr:NYN domain-containing protein [Clostridia bacterium]
MRPLLIVDGYNVIGAWQEVRKKGWSIDDARDNLTHKMAEHCRYLGAEGVLVFDGYKSDRKNTTLERHSQLTVVYTRHGETADSYIERLVVQTPRYRTIRVATSDGAIQNMALGAGATRITSRELLQEMEQVHQSGYLAYANDAPMSRNRLMERLPADVQAKLERMRRGE